jgi:hypothetical protein
VGPRAALNTGPGIMGEWPFLAFDAALGAAGAVLGWVATRRLRARKKTGADAVTVAVTVLSFTVGGQLLAPRLRDCQEWRQTRAAGRETFGSARAAALYADTLLPLVHAARLKERLASQTTPDALKAGVAQLTHAGLARLSTDELERLFDLKRVMAAKSTAACAGFWTGTLPPAALAEGLRGLDEDQQRAWITTTGRALELELGAQGESPRLVADAVARVTGALAPDGLAAFAAASKASTLTTVQACATFRAVADGIKALPPVTRDLGIRMLTNPELLPP